MPIADLNLGQLFFAKKAADLGYSDTTFGGLDPKIISRTANGDVTTLSGTGTVSFRGDQPPTEHIFDLTQTKLSGGGFEYDGTIAHGSETMAYTDFQVVPNGQGGEIMNGSVRHGTNSDIKWEFSNFEMNPGNNGDIIVNGQITKTPTGGESETFFFENAEFQQNPDGTAQLTDGKILDGDGNILMDAMDAMDATDKGSNTLETLAAASGGIIIAIAAIATLAAMISLYMKEQKSLSGVQISDAGHGSKSSYHGPSHDNNSHHRNR